MENAARRTHIYAFCAATTLFWFAMYTYVPILAPYVEHLGGSLSMAGLVVGSYGFTQMLVRIPIGFASDRLGRRKPFVILGLCLAAASSLGLGIATGPTAALIFRGQRDLPREPGGLFGAVCELPAPRSDGEVHGASDVFHHYGTDPRHHHWGCVG